MSFFNGVKDWNLQVDLNKHVQTARDILQTSRRPDLVVISEHKKILGMMELTVQYEDRTNNTRSIKILSINYQKDIGLL